MPFLSPDCAWAMQSLPMRMGFTARCKGSDREEERQIANCGGRTQGRQGGRAERLGGIARGREREKERERERASAVPPDAHHVAEPF